MISNIIKTKKKKKKRRIKGIIHNPFPNQIFFHFVIVKKLKSSELQLKRQKQNFTIIITSCRQTNPKHSKTLVLYALFEKPVKTEKQENNPNSVFRLILLHLNTF